MVRFAADENFNNDVLEWAAREGRILLIHDVRTITRHAFRRVAAGLAMPGVIEVGRSVSVAAAIEEILLVADCSKDGEWEGVVCFLPLSRGGVLPSCSRSRTQFAGPCCSVAGWPNGQMADSWACAVFVRERLRQAPTL